jgi:hypothetical protein
VYYVPFKWKLPSPGPTSDFRMAVPKYAKKKMLYLTTILNYEFHIFVLLSMQIHVIHAPNITKILKGF